ncbi:MAG: hypothetical protein ACJAYC_000191 [Halieaceae bacterium]|jgi:hypothetical protein
MPDQPTISYSYQMGGEPEQGKAAGPNLDNALYAFTDCELVNTGKGSVLLIHRHSDAQLIVSPEVTTALASCGIFRTLAEHIEELCTTIPQLSGQQANVTQVLDMVKNAGLLTTATATCERLCPPDIPAAVDLPATRAFIITCDRPAAIERLLTSMLHAGNLSRHEQLILIDDSRDPGNAAKNRELVENFNLTSPRNMRYFGTEEREKLLQGLIERLPEHEAGIRFLIDRDQWAGCQTYGLARTLSLLLSVNKRAIVMDDDVVCAAVKAPYAEDGVTFAAGGRETEFYASEQDLIMHTEREEFDPLSAHAQYIGLTMGQALNQLGTFELTPADLLHSNVLHLGQWRGDSPVLITQCGTVGDPGSPSTSWVYELNSASAKRALSSPGGLEGALTNRHYWLGRQKPAFSKLAIISQVTGLDNSALLPPYFPAFRGEDYLFGAMVEYLHPQSVVMEFDWSVPHFPIEPRTGNSAQPTKTGRGSLNWAKCITDETCYDPKVSTRARLASLIALIRQTAEASDQGLITRYRSEVAENQAGQAARIKSLIENDTSRPQPWTDWLQQSSDNINQALNSVAKLQDYHAADTGAPDQALLAQFREYANGFADSLAAWPAIRQAASELEI